MSKRMLTGLELEVMLAVWSLGGATSAETRDKLPTTYAPTTVSTVLRILEDKGFLKATKDGRRHIYQPTLSKAAYEKQSVKHLVHSVFDGNASQLVRTLFSRATAAELKQLEKMLGDKS